MEPFGTDPGVIAGPVLDPFRTVPERSRVNIASVQEKTKRGTLNDERMNTATI